MKKLLNLNYLLPLFILTFFLASCKKDNVDDNFRTPAAGLMAFNLAPDKTVGFALNGNTLSGALGYTSYTGAYLPVYPGTREIRSFNAGNGTTLAVSNAVFKDSGYYSLFAIGTNGNYRNVVVKDELDSLSAAAGQAYVRYINAITDSTASPAVTIVSGGATIINSNAAYASVSGFTKIAAGDIVVSVNGGSEINATRTINVEQGKIYTILLIGTPGSIDTDKAVQVKFITNGALN